MKFADIKANPRNPRRIRGDRFDKLQEYLQRFGDLSGVVVNAASSREMAVRLRPERSKNGN